ncbi:MAG: hypothetical protein U1G07_16820 [Verrucomicrobiota bacterium]
MPIKSFSLVPGPRPQSELPKITAGSGSELASRMQANPAAAALAQPGQSPGQYVQALEQNQRPLDAVNALAHGMPERESVWWACQSSQKVADKLNPAEQQATQAAEAWVRNPTPENQAAAAAAAAKTDYTGPGGWAAQAAAWSQPPAAMPAAAPGAGAPALPAASPPPALTPAAVSGSVLLAAGLANRPAMSAPQKPNLARPAVPSLTTPSIASPAVAEPPVPVVDQSKLVTPLGPFLDLGKDVASGQNSWT